MNKSVAERIYDHWLKAGIGQHEKLTDDSREAINEKLEDYTEEEIKKGISNYAEIVKSDEYFFKYIWSIDTFLKRGFESFFDLSVAKENFKKEGKKFPEHIKRQLYRGDT